MDEAAMFSFIEVSDLLEIASCAKMPPPPVEQLELIVERTKDRVNERARTSEVEAICFGAFSLLVEVAGALPGRGKVGKEVAFCAARGFLDRNSSSESDALSDEVLWHFIETIQKNQFVWEDLLINYLDPEAAHLERLRENLRLTPTERWRRHDSLVSQLRSAKRV